jgi:hypothetical protein
MKIIHLIIPDLFLPKQFAAEMSADLRLPALQNLLSCAAKNALNGNLCTLEKALCAAFSVRVENDVPIAPLSAAFDGLTAGSYLRADPVNLRLQRDQLLLSQAEITMPEAEQFCASLNAYFAGQGVTFFAPHPQRWYVQMACLPDMQTTPLAEVIGANVRGALPRGVDAARWHQIFNEAQMLLHAHPVNEQREARGAVIINSVWLWGGGDSALSQPSCTEKADLEWLEKGYERVSSDELLTEMFARAANLPYRKAAGIALEQTGRELLVYAALRQALQAGDLQAWREAVLALEKNYAQPLWQALRTGKIQRIRLDVLADGNTQSFVLTRRDSWRFWCGARRLAAYSAI